MGFGLLLVGYVFAFVATIGMGPYAFAGVLVGGFIMFLGLCELYKYGPVFIYALIANVLLLICSFYEVIAFAQIQLGFSIDLSTLNAIFDWIKFVIDLIFNIAMLYGIADISRRVEYPETRQKAIRNIFFVGAFNVFYLVLMLPGNIFESDKSFFMTLLLILNVMYVVMNAWLLFKCYAMICPAGQEDMQRKRSRFEFINKLHEMQDEREQRVIDGTKEYFENKLKQRNEKLKSKQSGSKSNKRKKKK
jgi:hypothetical protein